MLGLRLPARNLNLEARWHALMTNASFIRREAAALVTVSSISKGTPQARPPRLGFFVNNISACAPGMVSVAAQAS